MVTKIYLKSNGFPATIRCCCVMVLGLRRVREPLSALHLLSCRTIKIDQLTPLDVSLNIIPLFEAVNSRIFEILASVFVCMAVCPVHDAE